MTTDIETRFRVAQALASEAGDIALGYARRLGTLSIQSKGVQDMASEADLAIERMIREQLAAAFPEDGFLGEETGRNELAVGAPLWVVDPIDGTQPFISGLSGWCVSIALVADGVLQFGVVNAPARDELFAGARGYDATLNGERIGIRDVTSVTEGLTVAGYSPRVPPATYLPALGRLLEAGGMFYRDGSGALGLCYVAAGRLIGYMEHHINSWDCLGALAVVQAAGGVSNDFLAEDGLWRGNSLVAAGPALHPVLERLLHGTTAPA